MKKAETFQVLKGLQQVEASGTTLISLFLSSGKDVATVSSMLTKEKSACNNIKSKDTRLQVIDNTRSLLSCVQPVCVFCCSVAYWISVCIS